MDGLFVSHTEVPSAFIKSISNDVDYEVFLGPIELYDWDGQSFFDVNFALSLIGRAQGHSI
jgi:hypothetical protein